MCDSMRHMTWIKSNIVASAIIGGLVVVLLLISGLWIVTQGQKAALEDKLTASSTKIESLQKAVKSSGAQAAASEAKASGLQSDLDLLYDDARYSSCVWYWGGGYLALGLAPSGDDAVAMATSECDANYRDFNLFTRSGATYS